MLQSSVVILGIMSSFLLPRENAFNACSWFESSDLKYKLICDKKKNGYDRSKLKQSDLIALDGLLSQREYITLFDVI